LETLLETAAGKWVAYHGPKHECTGETPSAVYQKCKQRGLAPDELLVKLVYPAATEEPVAFLPLPKETDRSAKWKAGAIASMSLLTIFCFLWCIMVYNAAGLVLYDSNYQTFSTKLTPQERAHITETSYSLIRAIAIPLGICCCVWVIIGVVIFT